MLAHVKTRRIKFKISGIIPVKVIDFLKKEYGDSFHLDDELTEISKTDWFKKIKKSITPGDNIKIYRENAGITQAHLGEMLGGMSRQNISDMENGRRPVSKKTAKELSKILKVSVEKFI
jgi:DNA-binding XRE family transcriptional regulator